MAVNPLHGEIRAPILPDVVGAPLAIGYAWWIHVPLRRPLLSTLLSRQYHVAFIDADIRKNRGGDQDILPAVGRQRRIDAQHPLLADAGIDRYRRRSVGLAAGGGHGQPWRRRRRPVERAAPQECQVDLVLWGDFEAAASTDSLEKSVDYVRVLSIIQQIALAQEYNLIETLAYKIVRKVLQNFPLSRVSAKVRKRPGMLSDQIDFVEVEIEES